MPSSADGGLGTSLVGDKIMVNNRHLQVTKLLGEGGFSYVYLVKEIADVAAGQSLNSTTHGEGGRSGSFGNGSNRSGRPGSVGRGGAEVAEKKEFVLKVTSILSRQQRDIAEKEAKLLSRLSHPSIIKMFDTCYRSVAHSSSGGFRKGEDPSKAKERPQHLILLEFCEGGHALEVCSRMAAAGERFDLSTLIIAFGQICNAVSYLHAQRPPIVHRDLKPANFLIKNGAYKLCDFGSAVFGHVDLKTPKARAEAEEVVQKTTTQMFRSPEMVDLYMAKKLTQATDVWALGVCLYSLAFLQDCFEEGSNLAILSVKYKIPDDNPYGEGLVELIDRMLTVDCKARADMTEVILCLSAVYSGRPLPPRKERASKNKKEKDEASVKSNKSKKKKPERVGTFRTDGQGIYQDGLGIDPEKKPAQAKKLDPNSAAARRRQASAAADSGGATDEFASFHSRFDDPNPFSGDKKESSEGGGMFDSFDGSEPDQVDKDVINAFGGDTKFDAFASFGDGGGADAGASSEGHSDAPDDDGRGRESSGDSQRPPSRSRSGSRSKRRSTRSTAKKDDEHLVEGMDDMGVDDGEGSGNDEDKKSVRSRRSHRSTRSSSRRENSSGGGESRESRRGDRDSSSRSSRRLPSSKDGGEHRPKRSQSRGGEDSKQRSRGHA